MVYVAVSSILLYGCANGTCLTPITIEQNHRAIHSYQVSSKIPFDPNYAEAFHLCNRIRRQVNGIVISIMMYQHLFVCNMEEILFLNLYIIKTCFFYIIYRKKHVPFSFTYSVLLCSALLSVLVFHQRRYLNNQTM